MPTPAFAHLFEPLEIRGKRLKNRIMSSGHDTSMPTDNLVNEQLIAYHRARAEGGAGLIVLQVAGVHDSARYTSHVLMATDDACIEGYRKLAQTCHAHGTVVLSQVFHPGREIMESSDGLLAVAYSASSVPNERFRVMPRALDQAMIDEIVDGYAAAARRLHQAGIDGVEVVASHGYLPAQFINPRVNRRTDGYNGELEQRLRFLREVIAAVRAATDEQFIVGLRISADERDPEGLTEDESLAAVQLLQTQLDYVHIVAGTSASLGGDRSGIPGQGSRDVQGRPGHSAVRHRAHQPAPGSRADPGSRPGRCVWHDPRADLRPADAQQDRHRPRRRRAGVHCLQPGLHRALPQGLADFLHPAPGNRARTDFCGA
jgi:2,4-dienoyl-CoA reductase-like NADH-dependent reductase (Old Yellow Enzyme family)